MLAQLSPLAVSGAVARLQQLRQKQEVDNHLAEVEKLRAEQQRLRLAIAETESHWANTVAGSEKELLNRMAENHQRIAEINSHLSQIIVNNDKRLSSLDSEIAQVKLHLKYKEILAPVFGQVFNLKTFSGFVTSAADKKTVLKIVPDDHFIRVRQKRTVMSVLFKKIMEN